MCPFGGASFHGHAQSTAAIVAIAVTPSNGGYWITSADGTVASFGDAVDFP